LFRYIVFFCYDNQQYIEIHLEITITMIESNITVDSTKERAKTKLQRDMGPLLMSALTDPKTVEIMVNADGKIWQERLGEKMTCIGTLRAAQAEAIVKTIAGFLDKEITRKNPILEGEFPLDGSRFAGQLPPIVPAPAFAIRKKAVAIFTLEQYVAANIMTPAQHEHLKTAIAAHRNILVIGGTGSGKTTLVNAIINGMVENDPSERIFIIEDTGEIQCAAENFVQYHTSIDVPMTALLKTTLRMRPDRILVGEVRGPEALDLLDAWNTGHEGGAATLHANNAAAGLARLKSLITRNAAAPSEIEPLIGEVVHVVVHIARTPEGRRIQEILEISGYENGRYITRKL
jgi:P-type conjugative transfer ATPase TrbB